MSARRSKGVGLWARISVAAARHPALLECSPPARWLWLASILYSREHETDGFISAKVLLHVLGDATLEHVDELVAVGLWEASEEGFRIRHYAVWQETAREVERAKKVHRAAGKKGAAVRWNERKPATGDEVPSDTVEHGKLPF